MSERVVFGIRPVEELLRARPREVSVVYVADGYRSPEIDRLVMAARDDATGTHHQRADRRIRMRPPPALLGLEQSQTHELVRSHFFGAIFRSEISSLSSLMNSLRSLKLR